MQKHNIKLWYDQLNKLVIPTNIYLVYIKKEEENGLYPLKTEENEDDILVIKPLSNIKLTDVDATIKSNKQLILYFDKQINLASLQIIKHNDYRYLYFNLNSQNVHTCLHTFENTNPVTIVQNNIGYIKNIFDIFLTSRDNEKPIFNLAHVNRLLLGNKRHISLEIIRKDITYLEHHNKLTSRLAIFIYKLCTFKFHASDKEIGLYFSNNFGKSKPLNKKSYDIENVKGYDISTYPDNPIYNTKVQIALHLSNMQNQIINRNTILQATGIDISNI